MTNKIALITGANRGLGRSMALHLAKAGVSILGTYRTNKGAILRRLIPSEAIASQPD